MTAYLTGNNTNIKIFESNDSNAYEQFQKFYYEWLHDKVNQQAFTIKPYSNVSGPDKNGTRRFDFGDYEYFIELRK